MKSTLQIQKLVQNTNFFSSTVYDLNDLRGVVSPFQRFVVRHGDLIVTNYLISHYNQRGISRAYLRDTGKYYIFRESHVIIPMMDSTILFHNEHGLVIIPYQFERLYFYTFMDSSD